MSDSDDDEAPDPKSGGGALSVIRGLIGDLIAGAPGSVRRNAAKAFGQLITATLELPVVYVEDITKTRRAETEARVKIIRATADQIAGNMLIDPEYARAAIRKYGQKIIRERVNIDQISAIAADELNSLPSDNTQQVEGEIPAISDDWLNVFENEAAQISTEQMQEAFGKILAGEIHRPGSFSIKTIRLMAQLDNRAATLFRTFCSLALSHRVPQHNFIIDARVVSMGSAGNNSLQAYGLSFDFLNILQEYDLIISDYNSYLDYQISIVQNNTVPLPITYQNRLWVLQPKEIRVGPISYHVHGVALSRSGKELLPIIEIGHNDDYTAALRAYFDNQGVRIRSTRVIIFVIASGRWNVGDETSGEL